MIGALSRNWWAVLLRGILAIVFGILALAWPGVTLEALVLLFGLYVFMEGVVNVMYAFQSRSEYAQWWVMLLEGLVSLGAAITAFVWPGLTALVLIYVIGFWAIVTGALEITSAWRLRALIENELWMGLSGLLSILFGLAVVFFPGAGALALVAVIGIYAILFGVFLLALGWRLRGLNQRLPAA